MEGLSKMNSEKMTKAHRCMQTDRHTITIWSKKINIHTFIIVWNLLRNIWEWTVLFFCDLWCWKSEISVLILQSRSQGQSDLLFLQAGPSSCPGEEFSRDGEADRWGKDRKTASHGRALPIQQTGCRTGGEVGTCQFFWWCLCGFWYVVLRRHDLWGCWC